MNISNPAAVQDVGIYSALGNNLVENIMIDGNLMYLDVIGGNTQVVNISNPANPQLLSTFSGSVQSLSAHNSIAYVGFEDSDVGVFDMSNPQNPVNIGSVPVPGTIKSMVLKDNYLYIAQAADGFLVYNVQNPQQPVLLNTIQVPTGCSFQNSYNKDDLLIMDDACKFGFALYHLTNPAQPELIAYYDWNMPSSRMWIDEGKLFTINGYNGMSILNLNALPIDETILPVPEKQISAYPNPFHSASNVTFETNLKAGEQGTISVYNLKGQKVKSFAVNSQTTKYTWDGKNENNQRCAEGVYLYKISTSGLQQTKKLILLK
jgi:hypothetical protein